MGLFNKLKNALFEDEIEVPIESKEEAKTEPQKEEKKVSTLVEEKKEVKKPNVFLEKEEQNERELFKVDNTFKFPEFDEEEFKSNYKTIEKNEKEDTFVTPKERFDRVKPVSYEFDKRPKATPIHKETKIERKEEKEIKTFKPSPVISPVYGILDKNYKKEDIVTVKKEEKHKKKFDIDAIRKKAFGTLEEDIEKSIDNSKESFYDEKKANDLLEESTNSSIDITQENKISRNKLKEIDEKTISLPKSELRTEKRRESVKNDYGKRKSEEEISPLNLDLEHNEKAFEEDTLENDLFDLIDSMYDNREDDE